LFWPPFFGFDEDGPHSLSLKEESGFGEPFFPVTVLPTMVVSVLLGLLIVFFIFSFFLQYFVCVHLYVDIMLIHIPVVIGIISILICPFYRGKKYTHVCAKLKLMFEFLYDL
jgi:hypothetical protein